CDSTPFSKLVISSLGGTYVSSFTVHSCATVFVANDSFAGVVLSDRLEFYGIGKMYSVGHLFMGGSIQIRSSEGFLLAASSVEELLLEGVDGQLDETFLLNASIQLATIQNSTLQMDRRDDETIVSQRVMLSTISQQTSLHITNVTMSSLVPRLLTQFEKISNLRIVDCKIRGTPARAFFSSLTTTRLSVINTTLDCDPEDCEMNSMFLKPPRHVLLWTFEGNSCRTPLSSTTNGKTFCAQPTVFHQSGLTCRLSWAIADCVCTGSSASLPDLNASVFIIGDCEHLTPAVKAFQRSETYTSATIRYSVAAVTVGKDYAILCSDRHSNFLRKNKKDPAEYRPDILHQCLLNLLDSPLNRAGQLQVFFRTNKNVLVRVSPQCRIPRTFDRFCGLMG
ncbi:hypothetical protein TELCIR_09974, partial [Teladorsagia circumcincta]